MVPTLSIVFMAITCIVCIAIPVVLLIVLKKKGAALSPFFIGCAVMFLFVFVAESLINQVVVLTGVAETIQKTVWLYALYGGLMAGLFEETGRFLAFKTVLRKKRDNDLNALMYGAGHAGFEAVALVSAAMISNIVMSVMINTGTLPALTGSLPSDALEQINAAVVTLKETAPYMFLFSLLERVFAIGIHLSLSVIVWFGVKNRKWYLYPAAILLHALVDGVVVLLQGSGVSTGVLELFVGAMTVAVAALAVCTWKIEKRNEPVQVADEPLADETPAEETNADGEED